MVLEKSIDKSRESIEKTFNNKIWEFLVNEIINIKINQNLIQGICMYGYVHKCWLFVIFTFT